MPGDSGSAAVAVGLAPAPAERGEGGSLRGSSLSSRMAR